MLGLVGEESLCRFHHPWFSFDPSRPVCVSVGKSSGRSSGEQLSYHATLCFLFKCRGRDNTATKLSFCLLMDSIPREVVC